MEAVVSVQSDSCIPREEYGSIVRKYSSMQSILSEALLFVNLYIVD